MTKSVYNRFSKREIRFLYVGLMAIFTASVFAISLSIYSRTEEDDIQQRKLKMGLLGHDVKDVSIEFNDAPISETITAKAGEMVSVRVSLKMVSQSLPTQEVHLDVFRDEAYGRVSHMGINSDPLWMTLSERDGRLEATAPWRIPMSVGQFWLCLYYETPKNSRGSWESVAFWRSRLHVVR